MPTRRSQRKPVSKGKPPHATMSRAGRTAALLMPRKPAGAGGPVDVSRLRGQFGLTRKMFSRLTGYSERAIAEWETGKPPGDASQQRMVELDRLRRGLARIMKEDFIGEWLQTPNDAFDGLKPIEVIERGETDRLWHMVYLVESGVPG